MECAISCEIQCNIMECEAIRHKTLKWIITSCNVMWVTQHVAMQHDAIQCDEINRHKHVENRKFIFNMKLKMCDNVYDKNFLDYGKLLCADSIYV